MPPTALELSIAHKNFSKFEKIPIAIQLLTTLQSVYMDTNKPPTTEKPDIPVCPQCGHISTEDPCRTCEVKNHKLRHALNYMQQGHSLTAAAARYDVLILDIVTYRATQTRSKP